MKENHFIRVMRALDEHLCAPEYASNLLVVELLLADFPADTSELSVRIHSANFQLSGTDVWQKRSDRTSKKIRFNILSEKEWEAGDYYAFVYRNGRPLWFTRFFLAYGYEEWKKIPLQTFEGYPDEHYFAEKLCFTDWWHKIYQCRYKVSFIEETIRKLRRFAETGKSVSPLLVVGEGLAGKAFSYFSLSSHFSNENTYARYSLSLKELTSKRLKWENAVQEISQKSVVVAEVPELNYGTNTVNLLNMLATLLACNAFPHTTFIFQGTEKRIRTMRSACLLLDRLFTDEHTFTVQTEGNQQPVPFFEENSGKRNMQEGNDSDELTAEQQLQEMVGLGRLKQDMEEARTMALFIKERKELCLEQNGENRHHMLFLGNPGTGKTTVAKLVGRMYHDMGLLSSGHTVVTSRTGLVGEYIGQTEKNMREVLEKAKGGVLFIDEAYTLNSRSHDSNDYGKEVIHALLAVLSEPDPDMIVILAGYEDKMKELLRTNPGLKDRFPLRFHFDDYTSDELLEIALRTLKARNYTLTHEAGKRLKSLIEKASAQRDEYFGNGRWVHNLIEQGLIKSMARRVMSQPSPCSGYELFSTLEAADVEDTENRLLRSQELKITSPVRIGFRA